MRPEVQIPVHKKKKRKKEREDRRHEQKNGKTIF
jgi:hypothetical protein